LRFPRVRGIIGSIMVRILGRWLGVLSLVIIGLLPAEPAAAMALADSPYTLAQTYGTALRLLRVDLGFEVVERDPDAAYLLFRYAVPGEPKREVQGAIEFVSVSGRVRVVVKIPRMAELHERMLRDSLMKKLVEDYGEPPPPPAPPRPVDPKAAPPPAKPDDPKTPR
jgi:hypothetical protein